MTVGGAILAGGGDVVGHDLGALRLVPDARDVRMVDLEPVRAALGGLPATFDLSDRVAGVYDQGTIPACACYSAAAMQSIFELIEQERWLGFDALECYRALGGTGGAGVESHDVLEFMQHKGLLVAGDTHRYRIGSYAFLPLGNGGRIDVAKAALAAKRPPVLAMLLPLDWGKNDGQSAGGAPSGSYHQVCLTGYDQERAYFVNSQGVGWGDNGFGSVPWSFLLRGDQSQWCYAYTAIDAIDDALVP